MHLRIPTVSDSNVVDGRDCVSHVNDISNGVTNHDANGNSDVVHWLVWCCADLCRMQDDLRWRRNVVSGSIDSDI